MLPPLEMPSWTFATAAGGDSLCWAPASPAFDVLKKVGRGAGKSWMEATLWSVGNHFVVPFRP